MRTSCPGSGVPQETKRSALESSAAAGSARPARLSGSRRTASMRGPRPGGGRQQADRAFGQAVHRRHRLGAEAETREAFGEAAQRLGHHRLGAVRRDAPRTQVQPLDLRIVDAFHAQFVGEVRRRRQRAAVAVDRAQPAFGARQERERRHHHQRNREVQARQPGADQPHVVIQRQPAHEHVVVPDGDRLADGADVGEQVGVREHHALRVAGAARGVLEEGDVVAANRHRQRRAAARRSARPR